MSNFAVNIVNPTTLRGSSGRKLRNARRDPRTKIMDLRSLRTPAQVINGQIVNNALLSAEEWIDVDRRIIPLAQYEMPAVMDLVDAGLVHRLAGIGSTISRWSTAGDMSPANVSMDVTGQGNRDLVNFELDEVPIPVIFKDVEMSMRMLDATRNEGTDIDLANWDEAARQVAIACEKMLLHGYDGKFLGKAVHGYTNHPNRMTVDHTTIPFNLAPHLSGGTNAEFLILETLRRARESHFRGPFNLYIPAGYDVELFRRFQDGTIATLNDWMQSVTRINAIKENDLLDDGNMILVQMQSNTVDWAEGFPLAPIEWEASGGMVEIARIITAGAPRLKRRQDGEMGVVHLSFQGQ